MGLRRYEKMKDMLDNKANDPNCKNCHLDVGHIGVLTRLLGLDR